METSLCPMKLNRWMTARGDEIDPPCWCIHSSRLISSYWWRRALLSFSNAKGCYVLAVVYKIHDWLAFIVCCNGAKESIAHFNRRPAELIEHQRDEQQESSARSGEPHAHAKASNCTPRSAKLIDDDRSTNHSDATSSCICGLHFQLRRAAHQLSFL